MTSVPKPPRKPKAARRWNSTIGVSASKRSETPKSSQLLSLPGTLKKTKTKGARRKSAPRKVNSKRKAREFARAYGCPERVVWMRNQPCAFCGATGFSESAHIETGGMGRKADFTKTIPACGRRFLPPDFLYDGCHALYDTARLPFTPEHEAITALATATQQRWENHLRESWL